MSFTAFTPHLLRAAMDWMVENRLADRINILVAARGLMVRSVTTGAELDMQTVTQKPHRESRDDCVLINLAGNACAGMQYIGENVQLHLAVAGWKSVTTFPVDDIVALQVWNGDTLLCMLDIGGNNAFLRQLDGQVATPQPEAAPVKDGKNRTHLRLVQ